MSLNGIDDFENIGDRELGRVPTSGEAFFSTLGLEEDPQAFRMAEAAMEEPSIPA
jgi:hypothetical protein